MTVNLAPADLPKEGGRFNLPIALGILAASGQLDMERLARFECAGELSLAGALRPVRGALAMARALRREGLDRHLLELVAALAPGSKAVLERATPLPRASAAAGPDLADIKGQAGPKRALEIAAAGGLSLLLVGPPGSGKSMLAQRLPGLLPALSKEEALESAAVLSLGGQFDIARWGRPVLRAPHHSASSAALVGGAGRAT